MPIQRYARDPVDSVADVARDRSRITTSARRWVAAACVLIAAAGIAAAWRAHEHSQPCWNVRQLIDFNRAERQDLKNKTYMPPAGSYDEPRVPTDADYRAWADGLQQRADRVTAPELAGHAHRLADLARDYLHVTDQVNKMPDFPPIYDPKLLPPELKKFVQTAQAFDTELRALDRACPAGTR